MWQWGEGRRRGAAQKKGEREGRCAAGRAGGGVEGGGGVEEE